MPGDDIAESTVVITGAASGIGLETARLFLGAGAAVVGIDRQPHPVELQADDRFLGIAADVSDEAAVSEAAERARRTAGLCSVLVSCAGVLVSGELSETSGDDFDRVIAVNLRGTFLVCRAFLPQIAERGGGVVVTVASATGLRPIPGLAAYAASKAGVVSLTRSIAIEWAADDVRSVCICPGPVDTPMGRAGERPDRPLVAPGEVARSILHVCSPSATSLTGAVLAIDGGRTLH